MSHLKAWRRSLFTHEDKFNAHKLLGLPCLAHFLVRTLSVPVRPFADMGFTASPVTLVLIIWHLLLSISSLVFKIPKMRIKEGSRIWPEFRLHSIVFACRSLPARSTRFSRARVARLGALVTAGHVWSVVRAVAQFACDELVCALACVGDESSEEANLGLVGSASCMSSLSL